MPPPEEESKITVSVDTGVLAHPPPPEVVDQFVVVEESQFPVHNTQYLLAIVLKFNPEQILLLRARQQLLSYIDNQCNAIYLLL